MNLDDSEYDTNISFVLEDLSSSGQVVRTGEFVYSGIIDLASINNEETRTLRIHITWENNDANNASDTKLGEVEDSKLTIPIIFHASQYLGETLVPYSG